MVDGDAAAGAGSSGQRTDDGLALGDLGGFVALLGLEVDTATPTGVTGHLDAGPHHHQPAGLVHGGVFAAVAETLASVGAALAGRDGTLAVGVSNTTDFFRPHREGRLDAAAEPIHVGRTQQVWQVIMTRAADGKLVARGQVRLQAVPADGGSAR